MTKVYFDVPIDKDFDPESVRLIAFNSLLLTLVLGYYLEANLLSIESVTSSPGT